MNKTLVCALCMGLLPITVTPVENRWVHTGDGYWDQLSRWSLGLPTITHDVYVPLSASYAVRHRTGQSFVNSLRTDYGFGLTGGTLSVAAPSQIGSYFTMNSGTLGGAGSWNVGGLFTMTGGYLAPGGAIRAGSLLIDGNTRIARQVEASGDAWVKGNVDLRYGKVMNNTGSLRLQANIVGGDVRNSATMTTRNVGVTIGADMTNAGLWTIDNPDGIRRRVTLNGTFNNRIGTLEYRDTEIVINGALAPNAMDGVFRARGVSTLTINGQRTSYDVGLIDLRRISAKLTGWFKGATIEPNSGLAYIVPPEGLTLESSFVTRGVRLGEDDQPSQNRWVKFVGGESLTDIYFRGNTLTNVTNRAIYENCLVRPGTVYGYGALDLYNSRVDLWQIGAAGSSFSPPRFFLKDSRIFLDSGRVRTNMFFEANRLSGDSSSSVVNSGDITGRVLIRDVPFINYGVFKGDLDVSGPLTNFGTLNATYYGPNSTYGALQIDSNLTNRRFVNHGVIVSSTFVRFTGHYSMSDLGTIQLAGGSVQFEGIAENTNRVMNIGDANTYFADCQLKGGSVTAQNNVHSYGLMGLSLSNVRLHSNIVHDAGLVTLTGKLYGGSNSFRTTGLGQLILRDLDLISGNVIAEGESAQFQGATVSVNEGAELRLKNNFVSGAPILDNLGTTSFEGNDQAVSFHSISNAGIISVQTRTKFNISDTSGEFFNGPMGTVTGGGLLETSILVNHGRISSLRALKGNLVNHGQIQFNDPTSSLTVTGSVALGRSSMIRLQIGNGSCSRLQLAQMPTLSGGLIVSLSGDLANAPESALMLAYNNPLLDMPTTFGSIQMPGGYSWRVTAFGLEAFKTSAVPEPATLAALSVAVLSTLKRRKSRQES